MLLINKYQRSKLDNNPDELFYFKPKFTHHLDSCFRKRLTSLYQSEIKPNSKVLDLMSSWVSHLPIGIKYKEGVGHGLNNEELKANEALDNYWIQNLNSNQELPFKDNIFDICLIVAGWQYLQYPEFIAKELSRISVNGGKLIISFSNRAFWNKATMIWSESTDFQRIEYISKVLNNNGWKVEKVITESDKKPRIMGLFSIQNDPFFSVISNKLNY